MPSIFASFSGGVLLPRLMYRTSPASYAKGNSGRPSTGNRPLWWIRLAQRAARSYLAPERPVSSLWAFDPRLLPGDQALHEPRPLPFVGVHTLR